MTIQSDRLKVAMKLRKIKQIRLAEATGVNHGTISNYMRGIYAPRGENLTKIADALGVSEAWLAGFDVPMSPEASGSLSASAGEREFLNSRDDWSFFRSEELSLEEMNLVTAYRDAEPQVRQAIKLLLKIED